MTTATVNEIHCSKCEKSRNAKPMKDGSPKLPIGWHREAESVLCGDCWNLAYFLRAVTVPIVVGGTPDDKKAFYKRCDAAFANATTLANWYLLECVKADCVRTPTMEKLPPLKVPYLYPVARTVVPTMDSSSVTSVMRAVESKYRKRRFAVIWTRKESLPVYRYPTPYPIHNKAWKLIRNEEGSYIVSARCMGERMEFVVGMEFVRSKTMLDRLAELANGTAVRGELAIVPGKRRGIQIKLVGWFPRKAPTHSQENDIHVSSGPDYLLVARLGHRETRWHLDHLRDRITRHDQYRQAMADDMKHEKRVPKRQTRDMLESLKVRCGRMNQRIDAAIHDLSSQVIGWAKRNRGKSITLDDSDQSYMPHFPWSQLRQRIQYKCDDAGITFAVVARGSSDATEPGGSRVESDSSN